MAEEKVQTQQSGISEAALRKSAIEYRVQRSFAKVDDSTFGILPHMTNQEKYFIIKNYVLTEDNAQVVLRSDLEFDRFAKYLSTIDEKLSELVYMQYHPLTQSSSDKPHQKLIDIFTNYVPKSLPRLTRNDVLMMSKDEKKENKKKYSKIVGSDEILEKRFPKLNDRLESGYVKNLLHNAWDFEMYNVLGRWGIGTMVSLTTAGGMIYHDLAKGNGIVTAAIIGTGLVGGNVLGYFLKKREIPLSTPSKQK